jgi:hypothetical protein
VALGVLTRQDRLFGRSMLVRATINISMGPGRRSCRSSAETQYPDKDQRYKHPGHSYEFGQGPPPCWQAHLLSDVVYGSLGREEIPLQTHCRDTPIGEHAP